MLPLTSCDPDKGNGPISEKISKEEVQLALWNSTFKVVHHSESISEDGVTNYVYAIEPSDKSALSVKGEIVKITNVEFVFDEELLSTDFMAPYRTTFSISDNDVNHKLYARIYGQTCDENNTFIIFPIHEFEPNNYEITKEDVKMALLNTEFITSETTDHLLDGTVVKTMTITKSSSTPITVRGEVVNITKAELFVNDELVATDYVTDQSRIDIVLRFNITEAILTSELRLYGATNPENETYIIK